MATNSSTTSKSSPDVNYLQIYKSLLKNDQEQNGASTIPVEVILIHLLIGQVLSGTEYEMINHAGIAVKKLLKLFIDILPSKGEKGFDQLIKILFENSCDRLAKDLNELMRKEQSSMTDDSNDPTGDIIPKEEICLINQTSSLQNPQMKGTQAHLSSLIKKNVDFMAKYWDGVIPLAQTEAAFVQVQVLDHFMSENRKPVGSYRELFDKDEKTIHKRILIQADPGCGKTTYVNKLALDWANKDEYLRDKFDFVFLIPLQMLTMDMFDAIKWFLPDDSESEQFFASYAKNGDSKILLILDGFDILVENSKQYSSVMDIMEGKSKQFQFFHLIVTTRRSHVQNIPRVFHGRVLLIKGFDEESMKQFLIKQNVPLPSVGKQFNFSMANLPLEVLEKIFFYLSPKDQAQFELVCWRFFTLVPKNIRKGFYWRFRVKHSEHFDLDWHPTGGFLHPSTEDNGYLSVSSSSDDDIKKKKFIDIDANWDFRHLGGGMKYIANRAGDMVKSILFKNLHMNQVIIAANSLVYRCTNLEEMKFEETPMSPFLFLHNKKLSQLVLKNVNLEIPPDFADFMGRRALMQFTHLHLEGVNMQEDTCLTIFRKFGRNLHFLYIDTFIPYPVSAIMEKCFSFAPNIKQLTVCIDPVVLTALFKYFANLESLCLSFNDVNSKYVIGIPQKVLYNLRYLNLSYSRVDTKILEWLRARPPEAHMLLVFAFGTKFQVNLEGSNWRVVVDKPKYGLFYGLKAD